MHNRDILDVYQGCPYLTVTMLDCFIASGILLERILLFLRIMNNTFSCQGFSHKINNVIISLPILPNAQLLLMSYENALTVLYMSKLLINV